MVAVTGGCGAGVSMEPGDVVDVPPVPPPQAAATRAKVMRAAIRRMSVRRSPIPTGFPVSTIATMDRVLVIIAMEAEAAPLISALEAREGAGHDPLPMRVHDAEVADMSVRIVVNGEDPRFGADGIGTVPAALTFMLAVIIVWNATSWERARIEHQFDRQATFLSLAFEKS